MTFRLLGKIGAQAFELREGATLTVGRALDCDLPVLDPTVSRRHAELQTDAVGVSVRDLESRNGTFVNGLRVRHARLGAGDTVSFGDVAFVVHIDSTESSMAATRRVQATDRPQAERVAEPTPAAVAPIAPVAPLPRIDAAQPQPIVRAMPTPKQNPVLSPFGNPARQIRQAVGVDRDKVALQALLRVTIGLTRAESVEALLQRIAASAFEVLDIDHVSLLLADERGEYTPRVSRDRNAETGAPESSERTVPRSILRRVVEERVAMLTPDAVEDRRFGGESIIAQRVRSALCAPLIAEDSVLGVLYADNRRAAYRFDEKDLDVLVAFAGIAAVAIENARYAERIRREMVSRRNFERFFAPSLAARIAGAPDVMQLGGERRRVAVLFCDIRDFTRLSAVMTPDEIAKLLTEFFTEMVECVFRAGGTLDKFIGDAVMAQWGAPISAPDDADRAVAAAVDMMRAVDDLNVRWRAQGRPELRIGIGLDAGDAFAGNIGSERRMEYTVIGDPATIASRLCDAAPGGEILLSEEVRRALVNAPPIEACAPIDIAGRDDPVPIYRVAR